MYTTKSWIRGVVGIGVVVALAGSGRAAVRDQSRMSDQPSSIRQQSEQQSASAMTSSQIRRASQLIGKPVKNAQGEKLGAIHDLVLTPELDQVSYVALSRGGFLGIGQNLYAIPWSSIRVGSTGAYVASISTDELNRERAFSSAAWPGEPDRSWTGGKKARTVEERQTVRERQDVQNRRVSRINGMMVENPEGLKTGHIRDLAVAMDSGRVQYTIVSVGGTLGLGTQLAAVPQGAINLEPDRRVARLSVGSDVVKNNAFAAGRFPDLGDPSYARRIDQAYGMGTGETVLGYVPANESKQGTTMPSTTRSGTDQTPKTTAPDNKMQRGPAAGGTSFLKIDPQAKFDPGAVKAVEGVVTTVGKSAPGGGGPDILLLQIRTDNGDLVTVHAGPLNYVSKQDFYAVDGDRISVTGSAVRGSNGSEMLASRISKDGQVLTLRNRDGQPMWDRSSDEEQQSDTDAQASGQHTGDSSSEGSSSQTNETPTP
jgi:sporulation protein YlmC with PRC-barrel domain